MSKLIVEMEMPKSCPCDLSNGDTPCFAAHGIPKRWADFEKHSKLLHTRPWWCPIKGEISEIEFMHLEEERAFAARNIAAERKDDEA